MLHLKNLRQCCAYIRVVIFKSKWMHYYKDQCRCYLMLCVHTVVSVEIWDWTKLETNWQEFSV